MSGLAPRRYPKIGHDAAAIETLLVDAFFETHEAAPGEIGLDLSTPDDTGQHVGGLVAAFSSNECTNYLSSADYNSSKT